MTIITPEPIFFRLRGEFFYNFLIKTQNTTIYIKRAIMNTFFTTREIEGRYEWIALNMKDILSGKKTIHYTEDPFEVYDFDMTASTALSYGEIKTVHRDYTKFPNFQIDYKKLKSLQSLAKQDGRIPYLVCFFDDYTIVWDISGIDLEERMYTTFCTSTTADYTKGKREKEEVWLTIDEAIWKDYKLGRISA